MQKVLGDYKNRKKLLNYSKQNPLQSFYKRNFICWLIIAINFEQRDVIVLSVRASEPQDIETPPKIPRTLKVHKVLRTYNEDNVCKMEFYELADETDPFHIQWYRKEGDPEVCGHNQLPLSYEIDQTCGYCKERYKGNEDWLECKLCDQWFHEACFEK